MMSQAAPYLFWLGICLFAGAIVHSELLDRDTSDDALGDRVDGDIAFIPDDLKVSRFHSERVTR
jgi:hypothetical protein